MTRITERWYRQALCARFPNLPWITDPHLVAPAAVEAMRSVCTACPVRNACEAAVRDEFVSAGFWAGEFRDRDRLTVPKPRKPSRVSVEVSGGAA